MMWFGIVSMFGCPEPVDFSDRSVDNSTVQDNSQEAAPSFQAMENTAMPSDAANSENSEGAPPSMGTFAADLPESEIQPRFTQEALADGATLKGTANCPDCTGQILVRALPPPPEDPSVAMGEGMQLITQVVLPSTGNFSIQVPADAPVVLQVVDDANGDGVPSLGERMGMREEGAVFATGIIENISLMVGVFPRKDPIEGLGVIPTPPLPDEVGDGAMPADMIPSATGGQMGTGTPQQPPEGQGGMPQNPPTEGGAPAPDQVQPLGEQQPSGAAPVGGPPSDD
jgi:hypothetical protein